jgi:hypothetical protein
MLLAAWFAFTLHYYEDLLPTSFYVKAGRPPTARDLMLGLVYLASFAVLSLAWVPALRRRGCSTSLVRMSLVAGLLLTLAYGVFAGTRHMMYLYRLFVPYLPAIMLVLIPIDGKRRAYTVPVGCLAFQIAFAWFTYNYSENPSLSLPFESPFLEQETFEFSTLGARNTAPFLAAVEAQAAPIAEHWARSGIANRTPRIIVSTGGMLPYRLPDAYVLESLASHRHRCRPDLAAMADYQQVIYPLATSAEVAAQRRAQGQDLVHRQTVSADGLRAQPLELALEIWYEPSPQSLTLPPTIGATCVTAPPSPPRR